jgi:hypothetical protein
MLRLGQVVATSQVHEIVPSHLITKLIMRHQSGDDGDLCADDKLCNKEALRNNTRVLSRYEIALEYGKDLPKVVDVVEQPSPLHEVVYIITEWDRSVTTVLFDREY